MPYYILGIDPGTNMLGCAILKVEGGKLLLARQETLNLKNYETADKLGIILRHIFRLIKKYKPKYMAVEAPFFGKNPQSMLKLGRVQGIAIGIALAEGIAVTEYAPREIKKAVTGNGSASKQQVWNMVKRLVNVNNQEVSNYDTSDAIAVAYCHYQQLSSPHIADLTKKETKNKTKKVSSRKAWTDYVQKQKNNAKRTNQSL